MMKRLAAIRKRRRLSYRDIEKQTGIPAARMEELEKGAAGITVDELEKLLALYRVPIDRVMRFGRRRLLAVPAAMLAAAVLLAGAFFFLPEEWARPDSATAFPAGGTLAAAGAAGPEAANPLPERPADGSPEGGAPSGASAGPADLPGARPPGGAADGLPGGHPAPAGETGFASGDADADAPEPDTDGRFPVDRLPGADPETAETVAFRFWGNMPWHAERLPEAEAPSGTSRVIDVFPVQYVDDGRPDWLAQRAKDSLILNAGTSEAWTPSTVDGFERPKRDGYTAIGLGTAPDVYEPLIVEAAGRKIGFLSLAGLIRNAEEIALSTRVGLARAYRTDEVTDAVMRAKEKADYLFVLIDWGKRPGRAPNTSQRLIGNALIKAGADCVIGNRPIRAQDFTVIDGKPLFYALGHSVSDEAGDGTFNLMVEAVFSPQSVRLTVHAGKLEDGVLAFGLTDDDRDRLQDLHGGKELPDHLVLAWLDDAAID